MESKLSEIMNQASSESLMEEIKSQTITNAKLNGMAQKFLRLKELETQLKEEMDELKAYFKKIGSTKTDKFEVKIAYGSNSQRVKSLKEFIKSGYKEEELRAKGLITDFYSGDRVAVSEINPKEFEDTFKMNIWNILA